MRKLLIGLVATLAISVACQTAPAPAVLVAGGPQPTATRPPSLGGPKAEEPTAERGQKLVTEKGCVACHAIPAPVNSNGTIGPSLAGFANHPTFVPGLNLENNQANLRRWLANPPGVKPGTQMPNLGLRPDEIDSLIMFLQTLK